MSNVEHLNEHILNMRRNIIKMVSEAKSGHPGGSLSCLEMMSAIFFTQIKMTKENANSLERDRFVLSKGHAAPALYAVLAELGILEEEELLTLRKIGSRLQGHPCMRKVPGVDMSTGSLGQGISAAVGMALSNKYHENPYRIYTILGDGECQEGEVWEAAMCAAHYKLDNLMAFVDHNHLQIDGDVRDVMNPTPIDEKFKAFGWHVIVLEDGHDFDAIVAAIEEAKTVKGKPTVVVANTIKGKGVSFMENKASWHGVAPNAEQRDQALEELKGE